MQKGKNVLCMLLSLDYVTVLSSLVVLLKGEVESLGKIFQVKKNPGLKKFQKYLLRNEIRREAMFSSLDKELYLFISKKNTKDNEEVKKQQKMRMLKIIRSYGQILGKLDFLKIFQGNSTFSWQKLSLIVDRNTLTLSNYFK